jgi:hypothetical protein
VDKVEAHAPETVGLQRIDLLNRHSAFPLFVLCSTRHGAAPRTFPTPTFTPLFTAPLDRRSKSHSLGDKHNEKP